MRRYALRKDETQAVIVAGLREAGCLVKVCDDTPDLWVTPPPHGKEYIPLEVDGITKNRKRDKAQLEFLNLWKIPRVSSLQQALRIVFRSSAIISGPM